MNDLDLDDGFNSLFAPEVVKSKLTDVASEAVWKVLVVDDEPDIHALFRLTLEDELIETRPLQLFFASSAEEAKAVFAEQTDIALVLLDVVMETEHAGLALARYIREELGDHLIQIFLITGQPGYAPQRAVVMDYKINGYRLKSELTADRIFVFVYAAIRTHHTILQVLHQQRLLDEAFVVSGKEFRELAESMPQIVWIMQPDGWCTYFNQWWVNYTGLTLEESYGQCWIKPFHPDDQQRAWDAWKFAVDNNAIYSLECRLRRVDGVYRWWLIRGVPIKDDSGKILKWFGTCTDIDEIKRDEESLQLAAMVYRESDQGIIVTDEEANIIAVNPAFIKISGYDPDELIGKNARILKSGHHDKAFFQSMLASLNTSGKWQGEIWNRRKNGELYVEGLTINNILNQKGSVYRSVGIYSDISERKQFEELIWRQANFDELTGLPNRRMVNERLELDIKKANRDGKPIALMFIDLDRFKEVNDTLGHLQGDALLKDAANCMLSCVLEVDTVGR